MIAVAIAWAESGLRTDAIGYNRDPDTHQVLSRDRGLWQINDYWHPDVSDACAFDRYCNAQAMYRISSNGTNWHPWSTYENGAYRQYFAAAMIAVSALLAPAQPTPKPSPADATLAYIRNGGGPIHAIASLLQALFDETMDAKYGPGHRTGPIMGGIIK